MRWLLPALLTLLVVACEDVDRYATPTPAPFAGVVVASTDQRLAEGEAVAGVSARREQPGGVAVIATTPAPAATPRPIVIDLSQRIDPSAPGTPVPTAVAGVAERRGTPVLDRRAAATATARASLERIVRPGVADEARRAQREGDALLGAGGTAAGTGTNGGAIRQVGAGELARVFSGLPRDEARCSELALVERGTVSRQEAGIPVAGSARTEILIQQLEAGCLPEGVALTPELAQALAARPPLGGGTTAGAGADGLGTLARPETSILNERDRSATADRFAREDDLGAPGLAPPAPRQPAIRDRPVTSRPALGDTLRSATGTGP